MFDVGFSELLVIALVALLVLGPERLPGAARTVGALVRRARQSWASLQSELEREIGATEIKSSLESARATLESAKATPELSALEGELRGVARSTSEALRSDAPPEPPRAPVPAPAAAPEPEPPHALAPAPAAAPGPERHE